MRKLVPISLLPVIAMLLAPVTLTIAAWPDDSRPQATISGHRLHLDIADSDAERIQGLSGRRELARNWGMLFIFDRPGKHCLWMKDMYISIDMIWFDEAMREVHREQDVTPDTFPASFCPPVAAKFALEVSAGVSREVFGDMPATLELSNR